MLLPSGAFSWWLQRSRRTPCQFTNEERKGTHWHYYFRVRGVRYRGVISETRTKKQAEQAESKIKQEIFEGRFGLVNSGTMKLAKLSTRFICRGPSQTNVRGRAISATAKCLKIISKANRYARSRAPS